MGVTPVRSPAIPRRLWIGWLAILPRLTAACAAVLALAAIALGRIFPPGSERLAERCNPPLVVDGLFFEDGQPRLFDTVAGRELAIRVPAGRPNRLSISPWIDGRGRPRLAGQLGDSLVCVSFPDGRILRRSPLGTDGGNLSSPPCWFPDSPGRLLFTMWDGSIYEHSFDRITPQSTPAEPRRVALCAGMPQSPEISDLCWPPDPRLRGRLFAAIRSRSDRASKFQLWWLRLDRSGLRIVEAGRLMDDEPARQGADEPDERFPAWALAEDGSLRLAYLSGVDDWQDWHLHAVRVTIDPTTGVPTVRRPVGSLLAGCLPSPVMFSAGVESIAAVVRAPRESPRMVRVRADPPGPPAASPPAGLVQTAAQGPPPG